MKTRPCIFIGYGEDEFGYIFYDLVQKKLIKSRDMVFLENQDIKDIAEFEESAPQFITDLIDFNIVPTTIVPSQVEYEVRDDQQGAGDVDTPIEVEMDNEVHEQ